MLETQRVDRNEIEKLIPHAGTMCLLDEVIQWDDKNISCISRTHLDVNNPLREADYLPIYALIEYGAQAMAIHGGLLAKRSNKKINEGYLAALRNVKILENIKKDYINDIQSELSVAAQQQMISGGNMIYTFSVTAENELLISGRATVVAIY